MYVPDVQYSALYDRITDTVDDQSLIIEIIRFSDMARKEMGHMIAVNCSNFRNNMKSYMDRITGYWSRRINDKDRLIYRIDDANVYILACRYHYND